MAQVNRNSAGIADIVAVPRVPVKSFKGPGSLFEVADVVTPAADDSANSIHRFVRVPSNARVSQVLFSSGDASSAGAINVGLYDIAENGGAVVDADLFASALDLTGGPFNNLDITYESGEYSYAESVKPLWEVLGLSADPKKDYDVAATISTNYNGADTVQVLKVRFAI